MFTTGEIVGLAEWIIDDICLIYFLVYLKILKFNHFAKAFHPYKGSF